MKIGDQLCGEYGPRFVGYGTPPRVGIWRYIAEWTTVLFIGSLLIMAVL